MGTNERTASSTEGSADVGEHRFGAVPAQSYGIFPYPCSAAWKQELSKLAVGQIGAGDPHSRSGSMFC